MIFLEKIDEELRMLEAQKLVLLSDIQDINDNDNQGLIDALAMMTKITTSIESLQRFRTRLLGQ